jgi:hypothetical protein
MCTGSRPHASGGHVAAATVIVWFNIVLENHDETGRTGYLDPLIDYQRSALSACGHEVTVVWDDLRLDAVNLLFEYFPNPAFVDRIHGLRRASRFRLGIVATELIVAHTIPYAQHGMPFFGGDKATMLRNRLDGYAALSREVDFVWCWLQRTADETERYNAASAFFPVGHVFDVPRILRRSPRDIDVLFFGTHTPHRAHLLESMRANGVSVVCVGRGFHDGFCSKQKLDSLIDRAKIGLCMNLHGEHETAARVDPRFASCMRVVEMLKRETCIVSEQIPLDNPYTDYMRCAEPAALAETCRHMLADDRWRSAGQEAAARFRTEMDVRKVCAPVIERTLDRLAQSRVR